MPVNPRYLQQNNDFSRKPPSLSILIVIAAHQRLLEPPQGDTAPQEPSSPFSSSSGMTCSSAFAGC